VRAQDLLFALLTVVTLVVAACHSYSYHLLQVGTITSRAPHGSLPAMFVIDDTAFKREACGHATSFTFGPHTRIVHEDGTSADTAALTVGRRVSVFVDDNTAIFQSCPPQTDAKKIIVH